MKLVATLILLVMTANSVLADCPCDKNGKPLPKKATTQAVQKTGSPFYRVKRDTVVVVERKCCRAWPILLGAAGIAAAVIIANQDHDHDVYITNPTPPKKHH